MKVPSHIQSTYIALLRGINVGGHKIVKMDALRKAFVGMGCTDVATYVQSGNVVFKSPAKTAQDVAKSIEDMPLSEFSMSIPVVVRSSAEIAAVLKQNPFLKERGIDTATLHVTFLSRAPQKNAVKALDAMAAGADRFCCCGQEIYLHCPNGIGGTKLSINAFEKLLAVNATTRNWNTLNKLLELSLR